jgi:glyoxylase-like metal-dependent hydrolase (beta-lactamase superfamily II)
MFPALLLSLLPAAAAPALEPFPEHWIDGTSPDEAKYQVHEHALRTWIIRQSLTTHYEGPFIYLLAGSERALLFDTGATDGRWLREVVDHLIGDDFPLVVAHSHAHGDHVAGDAAFIRRPDTEIVGHSAEAVARFFEIQDWPMSIGGIDLGERELLAIPIPGHEQSSIALYDATAGIVLTGDTILASRIYVQDFEELRSSVDRLISALRDREVRWVLGAHIEMTAVPGIDFGPMQPRHPNERELQLTWYHVLELQEVLDTMGDSPSYSAQDDYIVYPVS